MVTPLRERRFPVLVEQAKSAEHLEKGPGPMVPTSEKCRRGATNEEAIQPTPAVSGSHLLSV